MSSCVHHWRQETGNLHAPFVCLHCGESRQMETDFYRLFEATKGRPYDRPEWAGEGRELVAAASR